jgi:hypothetical protein
MIGIRWGHVRGRHSGSPRFPDPDFSCPQLQGRSASIGLKPLAPHRPLRSRPDRVVGLERPYGLAGCRAQCAGFRAPRRGDLHQLGEPCGTRALAFALTPIAVALTVSLMRVLPSHPTRSPKGNRTRSQLTFHGGPVGMAGPAPDPGLGAHPRHAWRHPPVPVFGYAHFDLGPRWVAAQVTPRFFHESPPQIRTTHQGLPGVWPTVHLAKKMGAGLGARQILFGTLPTQQVVREGQRFCP